MSTTIELLTDQHQHVVAQLAAAEAAMTTAGGGTDLAAFAAYLEHEVMDHFGLEEQALFPILARHLSLAQGPLAVMNAEHVAFRDLLNSLAVSLRTGDLETQAVHAQELIRLLRGHIAKEDHVLFPMASQLLSAEEQGEVDQRAAALGVPRQGGTAHQ